MCVSGMPTIPEKMTASLQGFMEEDFNISPLSPSETRNYYGKTIIRKKEKNV